MDNHENEAPRLTAQQRDAIIDWLRYGRTQRGPDAGDYFAPGGWAWDTLASLLPPDERAKL